MPPQFGPLARLRVENAGVVLPCFDMIGFLREGPVDRPTVTASQGPNFLHISDSA